MFCSQCYLLVLFCVCLAVPSCFVTIFVTLVSCQSSSLTSLPHYQHQQHHYLLLTTIVTFSPIVPQSLGFAGPTATRRATTSKRRSPQQRKCTLTWSSADTLASSSPPISFQRWALSPPTPTTSTWCRG